MESSQPLSRSSRTVQLLLFLFLWFGYGLAINSGNLTAFSLQQAGVEAYVERRQLYLEGSQVELLKVQPVVDAFIYQGHIYPAKQPGQFMAGAIAYFPLHRLGLNYSQHYLLTAALVTFLTSSLVTALGALAVFRIVLLLQHSQKLFWPITVTLVYALATTAFPYSGIAWHDSLATAYLVVAFYFFLEARRAERRKGILTAIGGLLLGLTITTSMLPFLMTVVLAIYFAMSRPRSLLTFFIIGVGLGLLPLLIYNSICFGNPFLLPNVAGSYRDTFFHFNAANFLQKLRFYLHMVTIYVPVFWFGILGLALFPRQLRREQVLIFLMLMASIIYILNIEATGTCQYGPRYLLPAMPFACIGLLGFHFLQPAWRRITVPLVLVVAAISFAINLVGAMHGAMLCDFPHFAAGLYLSQMLSGHTHVYPLAIWLLAPFIACALLLLWTVVRGARMSGP
jgi:hypothetical protein